MHEPLAIPSVESISTGTQPTDGMHHSLRSAASPRDAVMAFYAAFDAGALDRFEGIAPDFEARVFGATVLDAPGFLSFARSFCEGFPRGCHVFDHVVVEGDKVVTIGRYRGRHERAFMGIEATQREVDFAVMHLDVVADGRLVEHRGIGDVNTMWAQLGVSAPIAG
jgi:predicted ester cyclase